MNEKMSGYIKKGHLTLLLFIGIVSFLVMHLSRNPDLRKILFPLLIIFTGISLWLVRISKIPPQSKNNKSNQYDKSPYYLGFICVGAISIFMHYLIYSKGM